MEQYKIEVKGIVKLNDKYLIIKKWYDDRIVDPYQWEFIDGKVLFGEEPDTAVLRLINENTGLFVSVNKILYTWNYMLGDVCNLGIAYLCEAQDDEVTLSEELHDYEWITKDQFAEYISNNRMLDDINKAFERYNM